MHNILVGAAGSMGLRVKGSEQVLELPLSQEQLMVMLLLFYVVVTGVLDGSFLGQKGPEQESYD